MEKYNTCNLESLEQRQLLAGDGTEKTLIMKAGEVGLSALINLSYHLSDYSSAEKSSSESGVSDLARGVIALGITAAEFAAFSAAGLPVLPATVASVTLGKVLGGSLGTPTTLMLWNQLGGGEVFSKFIASIQTIARTHQHHNL